jgi:hypothetical protein
MASGVYGLRLLRRPRVQRTALVLILAVVAVFRLGQFLVFTTQIQWGYDFSAYWQAARHLLDGLAIYAPDQLAGPYAPQRQFLYLYPPPLAAVVIPLAALFGDPRVANWAWAAIGAAILVATVMLVGRRHGLPVRWLVVGAIIFPPVIGELVLGNAHLLLLGLLAAAWLGGASGSRSWRGEAVAGVAVGAAALVKVFPGILVLWFLLTRRWRAAAWSIAGIVAITLATLPFTGLQPWRDYPTVLLNLSAPSDTHDTLAPTVWLAPALGFTIARVVVTGAGLALLGWAAVTRRAGARLSASAPGAAPAPRLVSAHGADEALSFGIAVAVSILVAPALYHHYLAVLVLPFLLGLAGGADRRLLLLAYLLMWGGTQTALGDLEWVVNRAMPTAGALVLLAALVWAAARSPRRT